MATRLEPLNPPFCPDVAAALAGYPQPRGHLLALFRTFANSRRFLKKGVPNLLDPASPLSLRIREIVILRFTANLAANTNGACTSPLFRARPTLMANRLPPRGWERRPRRPSQRRRVF